MVCAHHTTFWYNACDGRSPIYHTTATAVYLVQRITAACVVVMYSQSLYRSIMNSQRGRGVWEVVEYSLKERFHTKLQDVIGVCPSYCCLHSTTCVLVIYIEVSLHRNNCLPDTTYHSCLCRGYVIKSGLIWDCKMSLVCAHYSAVYLVQIVCLS